MFKATTFLLLLVWSSVANSSTSNLEIAQAMFDFGISKMKSCEDCEIDYLFLNVEMEEMNEEFYKHFFYTGLSISSSEFTESDCERGIRSKFTQKRGYALTVFKIENVESNVAKVKWGHWYSCKNYSNQEAIVNYSNGKWQVVSSDVGS